MSPPRDSFLEQYLDKTVKATASAMKAKNNDTYRFCYVNKAERICLNAVRPSLTEDPYYVLWDGTTVKEGLKEFKTPEGDTLKLPPITIPFYREMYKKVILPDTILDDAPSTETIDQEIEKLLQTYMVLEQPYVVIARNFIKYSWIYERFSISPSLYLYGDYGTGKTTFGKYIATMCMYGQVMNDVTVAALVRILDSSNSSVMLDEGDYIDGEESEKFRRLLRNGYERGGNYIITEAEGRNHVPRTFIVDQPKVIAKRQWGKDDALASRMIPIRMTPKDKEIPLSMRKNDEADDVLRGRREMRMVANLLLKWRFDNIFKFAPPIIIDDMRIRFNDTASPLLKIAGEEDKKTLINYMKEFEQSTKVDVSDQFNIKIFRVVAKLFQDYKHTGGTTKIFLSDVASRCAEEYNSEASESEIKRIYSSRNIKNQLKNLGLEADLYRNKLYLRWDSMEKMIPIIADRYGIKSEDEGIIEEEQDQETLLAEAEALLAVQDKEESAHVDNQP